MNTITEPSWEERLSLALDRYASFRVILFVHGLRFASEPVSRAKVDSMLRSQPVGMQAIEGLSKTAFTPEDWEEIAI